MFGKVRSFLKRAMIPRTKPLPSTAKIVSIDSITSVKIMVKDKSSTSMIFLAQLSLSAPSVAIFIKRAAMMLMQSHVQLTFSLLLEWKTYTTSVVYTEILTIKTFIYVVVQFYPWFNFYFLLFLGMVMYDNEFKTKDNKN